MANEQPPTVVAVDLSSDNPAPWYRGAVAQRIVVWLIFGVVFSLFPLGADYAASEKNGANPPLRDVLSQGELYIIAAIMAAGAIGEVVLSLIRNPNHQIMTKLVSIGFCLIFLGITCVLYGILKNSDPSPKELTHTVHQSELLFMLSLVASFAGITVAAVGE